MTAIIEDQLYHYIDGELGPEEAAELESRMENDPGLRARFDSIARQNALLKEASGHLERGSSNLKTAALERQLAESLSKRRRLPSRITVVPQWRCKSLRLVPLWRLVGGGIARPNRSRLVFRNMFRTPSERIQYLRWTMATLLSLRPPHCLTRLLGCRPISIPPIPSPTCRHWVLNLWARAS